MKNKLSIICPVYNEAGTIPLFLDRLRPVVGPLTAEFDIELLFVDNCSSDQTLQVINDSSLDACEIHVISLTRNFGYQASLVCGLTHATGDISINIDVDCEDPPELIPRFIEGWREGYDIVYGVRRGRPEVAWLTAARRLFYRLTYLVADSDFIIDMAEFLLLTAEAREAVLRIQTSFPFIRSEVGYVGFRRLGIPYDRQHRVAGQSNYNLIGLTRFALAGMLSASTFPLRLTAYVGLPLGALNLAILPIQWWWGAVWLQQTVDRINAAVLIMAISFIAIYLARTYKNGVQRPLFVVDSLRSRPPPGSVTARQRGRIPVDPVQGR